MLMSLTTLDLNHNQLSELPNDITELFRLQNCILDFNLFQEFPNQLFKMTQLQMLRLAGNPMKAADWPSKFIQKTFDIAIDNVPKLYSTYKPTPNVNIHWNKVYPDRVYDLLFLGSLRSAQSLSIYEELGIKYVLTCGRDMNIAVSDDIVHLVIDVDDTADVDIKSHFSKTSEFIYKARQSNSAVLVHCFKGVSRSPAVVCAYLMEKERIPFDEAMSKIRSSRPSINPNAGFRKQLAQLNIQLGLVDPGFISLELEPSEDVPEEVELDEC
eukprot:NODE_4359_length_1180_cov_74.512772_g3850_i0.p1 GENE.NODE_4359_length_1180_cov_74.512772_g3850_i0~~NODE_4359_length_1180_cov_74.512772_g3850_i0.p1  ORF type:complete len:301 (+),score=58.70 NODE_4359_length_1180_cov_74.512772_g3850_i0:94-903(+)